MEEEKNAQVETSESQESLDPFDRMVAKQSGIESIESQTIPETDVKENINTDHKTKEDSPDYEENLKKLEARATENQRFARSANQKIKEALKIIDHLSEEGGLDEETAGKIYGILKADGLSLPEDSFASKAQSESNHPFDKYKQMLDPELFQTYQDVSEDGEAERKLLAFDQYLREAEESELKALDKELSEIKAPMTLLKKILSVGNGFLEEGLGEFYKHGGFRKYLSAQKEENEKLKKEIDNLKRKLSQYDSTESSGKFWLASDSKGSDGSASDLSKLDPFEKMEHKKAEEQKRNRK